MLRSTALALFATLLAGPSAHAQDSAPVAVTVTAKGCEPGEMKVKAGRVTFVITNRSSRALEWEILKGVMIVDERENIAPGFKQRLTTTLEPGEYAVTCGLLSNPRGRLLVLNAQGGTEAVAAKPGVSELVGLSAEYRSWTLGQLDALAKAVSTGDRRAGLDVVLRLTPLAASAKPQADALEAALRNDAADPAAAAGAYAEALRVVAVSPSALLAGLAGSARTLAGADRADAPALLAGIDAPAAHLLPLVKRADPALGDRLTEKLVALEAALRGGGTIGTAASALADELSTLPAVLGLS